MGTPPESPRRSNASTSSSPEFQFWVDVNSSNANNSRKPQPSLHSADELFSGGILLPLHTVLRDADDDIQTPPSSSSSSSSSSIPSPALSSPPPFSLSRNWKDLFKPSGDTHATTKKQPPEKKSTSSAACGTGGGPAAELNIHLWPFSRSRSAGTAAAAAAGGGGGGRLRKSSSAPCSRSNSRGESSKPAVAATATAAAAPKRWGPIPGRAAGFRLGRSSPVWQFRRGNRGAAEAKEVKEKCGGAGAGGAGAGGAGAGGGDSNGKKVGIGRGLNLNVNTCIRYRNPLVSCRGYEKVGVAAANDARNVEGGGGVEDGGGGASGGLFNIRSIFSKKVY